MNKLISAAQSVLLLLLLSPFLCAQSPVTSDVAASIDTRQEKLEKDALDLLEDLIAEAQTLTLAENRAFIQANAAEMLWSRDPKRAQDLFDEARSNLIAAVQSDSSDDSQNLLTNHTLSFLRREMLHVASARDPQLALDFLRSTRSLFVKTESDKLPTEEVELEQSLSRQIALKDSKQALALAIKSLENGFSYELVNLLTKLGEQDKEAATKLTAAILSKLRRHDLIADAQAGQVVIHLLRTSISSFARTAQTGDDASAANRRPELLEASAVRELMDIVLTQALNAQFNTYAPNSREYEGAKTLVWSLNMVRSEVEKYAPARIAALRTKVKELNRTLDPANKLSSEYFALLQDGEMDAAMEIAAKAPAELRDMFYHGAAGTFFEKGDPERALEMINRISNQDLRDRTLAHINRQKMAETARRGKLDQANEWLGHIARKDERVTALVELAGILAKGKDKKSALRFLSEARSLAGIEPDTVADIRNQLEVAHGYSSLDPATSFEIIESLAKLFNKMFDAAVVLDRFDRRALTKREEFILSQRYLFMNGAYSRLLNELSALAGANFKRVRQSTNSHAPRRESWHDWR